MARLREGNLCAEAFGRQGLFDPLNPVRLECVGNPERAWKVPEPVQFDCDPDGIADPVPDSPNGCEARIKIAI